jgi:hypothetical protein
MSYRRTFTNNLGPIRRVNTSRVAPMGTFSSTMQTVEASAYTPYALGAVVALVTYITLKALS